MKIWSRRNFITVSSLCVVAAAAPVAAAKAASKVVVGRIDAIVMNGVQWVCRRPDESEEDFVTRVNEAFKSGRRTYVSHNPDKWLLRRLGRRRSV